LSKLGSVHGRATGATLRAVLRAATAPSHDRLDAAVGALDLADASQYAEFLRIQLAAREALEALLGQRMGHDAPPSQAHLLRADLQALNEALPARRVLVSLPAGADITGMCWAVAGSHLGNRMMMRNLATRAPAEWPTRFLADESMMTWWQGFRPALERPATPGDPAIPAACAAFDAFLSAAADQGLAIDLPVTEPRAGELRATA